MLFTPSPAILSRFLPNISPPSDPKRGQSCAELTFLPKVFTSSQNRPKVANLLSSPSPRRECRSTKEVTWSGCLLVFRFWPSAHRFDIFKWVFKRPFWHVIWLLPYGRISTSFLRGFPWEKWRPCKLVYMDEMKPSLLLIKTEVRRRNSIFFDRLLAKHDRINAHDTEFKSRYSQILSRSYTLLTHPSSVTPTDCLIARSSNIPFPHANRLPLLNCTDIWYPLGSLRWYYPCWCTSLRGDQSAYFTALQPEGHEFESSHHRPTSSFGRPPLTAALILKMLWTVVSLAKEVQR